jgi:hypothetical protein
LEQDIGYEVLDHSNASFDPLADVDQMTLRLGTFPQNSGGGLESAAFEIYNLPAISGFTAPLDIQPGHAQGDATSLAVDVAPSRIEPAEGAAFRAWLDTTVAGDFSATWTILTHDQRLPGAAPGADLVLHLTGSVTNGTVLQAGDADENLAFDQGDIVRVLQAAKYLSEREATWGEGDWDAAPGGQPGRPPIGDGRFDQRDIIAALQTGLYLQGPYAAAGPPPTRRVARAIPEPSSHLLMGLAVFWAIARVRRIKGSPKS